MSYHRQKRYDIFEVGVVQPNLVPTSVLQCGQVGYFMSNMKSISDAHIGDTFYEEKFSKDSITPFPGYEQMKPMVFAGIYPEDPNNYEELEKALQKLCLSDGSVTFNYESSAALGSGFRCGFLGMLHMDVFRQRIKDEYDMSAIVTNPTVSYKCKILHKDEIRVIDNPVDAPPTEIIDYWFENIVQVTIITPAEYLKEIRVLCEERRGLLMS